MNIAHHLPYCDILDELEIYDNSSPKVDELLFISNLCKKYNIQRDLIIRRIRQVRKIYNYINRDEKKKSRNKRFRRKVR